MRAAKLFVLIAAMPALLRAEPVPQDDLDQLPAAQIVVLGEVHDNPQHHLNQARAVTAMRPSAVVWEMLTPAQAAAMPPERGDLQAVAEALDWAESGWPDFDLYAPIFEAAGAARHYGAGVPRDEARRAFSDGAAASFGAGAERFGLDIALPDSEQAARETAQFHAHCEAMPMEMMGGMVEAQRLRDASLARAALRALAETGGPVAVIAGAGHARRDHGVPAMIAIAEPAVSVLSLGQIERAASGEAEDDARFDLWVVTEPVERPDPCASLR